MFGGRQGWFRFRNLIDAIENGDGDLGIASLARFEDFATFVRVARVKTDKHFAHDVFAGAVIGEASGWMLTSRKNDKVQWLPWGDAHGGGGTVAMRF